MANRSNWYQISPSDFKKKHGFTYTKEFDRAIKKNIKFVEKIFDNEKKKLKSKHDKFLSEGKQSNNIIKELTKSSGIDVEKLQNEYEKKIEMLLKSKKSKKKEKKRPLAPFFNIINDPGYDFARAGSETDGSVPRHNVRIEKSSGMSSIDLETSGRGSAFAWCTLIETYFATKNGMLNISVLPQLLGSAKLGVRRFPLALIPWGLNDSRIEILVTRGGNNPMAVGNTSYHYFNEILLSNGDIEEEFDGQIPIFLSVPVTKGNFYYIHISHRARHDLDWTRRTATAVTDTTSFIPHSSLSLKFELGF
ncbi:MAG: hypothetical protein OEL81_01930 [Nitrosopumilus sp.]|nr:hypothetical protein [Nitrosopumilus sp.]